MHQNEIISTIHFLKNDKRFENANASAKSYKQLLEKIIRNSRKYWMYLGIFYVFFFPQLLIFLKNCKIPKGYVTSRGLSLIEYKKYLNFTSIYDFILKI